MGTINCSAAAHVSVIAAQHTWIEGKAIQQLETTARLPGMVRVVGMPDLHPGRGYPIGAAFFSRARFYPALVGNDIGCGMALWRTGLTVGKPSADKLEKRLGSIDAALDDDLLPADAPQTFRHALGTIGGGNHFAELQRLDEIYQPEWLQQRDVARNALLLLVHSGSRGLGQAILEQHVRAFGHRGLADGTPEAESYLMQHQQALAYAELNRRLIAERMLARWRTTGECLLDVNHNLVAPCMLDGVTGWLHRKGATPADQGPVIIPGSRGDYSYLVQPVISADSLFSLAHGAGRKWMRSECRDRLSARYGVQQLERTRFGSRVICRDKQLLFQEAPEAYKPIDSVIDALRAAGLIEPIARLAPVLTYKVRGDE